MQAIDLITRNSTARSYFCTVLSGICPSNHRKVPTVLHRKSVTTPSQVHSICDH